MVPTSTSSDGFARHSSRCSVATSVTLCCVYTPCIGTPIPASTSFLRFIGPSASSKPSAKSRTDTFASSNAGWSNSWRCGWRYAVYCASPRRCSESSSQLSAHDTEERLRHAIAAALWSLLLYGHGTGCARIARSSSSFTRAAQAAGSANVHGGSEGGVARA